MAVGSLMRLLFTLATLGVATAFAAPALAQSCGEDLQKLSEKRAAAMASVNAMAAASKGKQLDPLAFCAKSQPLNAAENAMIAYMEKNKDWCQIPDDVIAQLKGVHAKNVGFSVKACSVASQMKKMKEQAQQGQAAQAQPLPAGPL